MKYAEGYDIALRVHFVHLIQ